MATQYLSRRNQKNNRQSAGVKKQFDESPALDWQEKDLEKVFDDPDTFRRFS